MSVPVLAPGDRVPNLTFPDLEGKTRLLYLEVFGGPILVAVAPDPEDAESRAILSGLAKRASSLDAIKAHRFVLTRKRPSDRVDPKALVMLDPYGDAMKMFRPILNGSDADDARSKASVAVLDANQRLVSLITTETARDPVGTALDVARGVAAAAARDPLRLDRAAPAMILDKLLSDTLCATLVERWEADHQEGTVSDGFKNVTDLTIKRNQEHVIRDPELQRVVVQQIGPRVVNEIQKVFNYRHPLRFEMLTVLSYDASRQDFFGPHRDNLRSEQRRRFALSLNLNDGYEGGELVFPEYGPHRFAPPKGAGAVFSCELLHQALPVTKGRRFVLTTFMIEPT
ncbi:MAG: 2OG-Fe(II) oxygenase [Alphaproteobacteria bacterium]|nr:2OG-Fe(II) oxygenase [Alphaproteobacteria bacterium]